ncbi:hypothetical protein TRFO_32420 [Tritrichomonas foetus]|uniref:Uncharacterized protein n=1 Tax=Tritrichomonas foetus TaxID=1144522 RepID=A0A1J4JNX2_9EUKA|nr:hypothetical protein TRFO_32420 [Tritrichomonas foetus]|eukprot:OHT00747.1 hypothetical protein TRFO_32420 [Tritrichomonas foetus]
MEKSDEIQCNSEVLEFTVNTFKNLAIKSGFTLLGNVWETDHRNETELIKWKDTLWSEIEVLFFLMDD